MIKKKFLFGLPFPWLPIRVSILLRLASDDSPLVLRSIFDRSSIPERSLNGARTELERSPNGAWTELERSLNGARTELERSPNGARTELERSSNGARTEDERMRIGGTREVHLTIIVNSYDNGKTQTNYWGVKMSLSTTSKSDKTMPKISWILNTLPNGVRLAREILILLK